MRIPAQGAIGEAPGTFKDEVMRDPSVVSVTASYGAPGAFAAADGVLLPEREPQWPLFMMLVDYDLLETYAMRIVAGRPLDPTRGTDSDGAFILNEAAARNLGRSPEEVLGQRISWPKWGEGGRKEGEVVGVVSDFNFESLHRKVQPIILHVLGRDVTHIAVFSGLALVIACLGLFALASFTVERRTRKIGIRKVLGASETGVSLLVAREFLPLVVVAVAIAWPVAWLAMRGWLERFAYRVEAGPWLFLSVGMAAGLVAALTVSGHSLRAARMNPVESLWGE